MSDPIEYSLGFSFNIDGGELDEFSPQDVFVRGFEAGKVWELCEWLNRAEQLKGIETGPLPKGMMFPVHSDNRNQLERICIHHSVKCVFAWLNDDWLQIQISK